MKKFKSTLEKQSQQQNELDKLLTEKHFLKGALIDYARLPVAATIALLPVVSAQLAGFPFLGIETLIFACMGLAGGVALHAFRAWNQYQESQTNLRYKTAKYVASRKIPILFWSVFLFQTLPFGWASSGAGLLSLLCGFYYFIPVPGLKRPLKALPKARHAAIAAFFAALVLIPLVAAEAYPNPWGLAWVLAVLLASLGLSLKNKLSIS